MRWLVVGAGSIGWQHLNLLKSLGEHELMVVEPNLAQRQRCVPLMGQKRAVAEWDDLPQDYDVALICSPTHLHHEHALRAATEGAHVIIEKPVDMRLEGEASLRAAMKRGKHGIVACPMRWHPGVVIIRQRIQAGEFGDIFYVRAWYQQAFDEWRPGTDFAACYSAHKAEGGGLFFDRIHEFDYLRWMLGEPQTVWATIGISRPREGVDVEDMAVAVCRHGECTVAIMLDGVMPGYNCGAEFVGTKGRLGLDYAPRHNQTGEPLWDGHHLAMREQTKHWIACCHGDAEPEQSIEDGYRVLNTAVAAYASAAAGRPAVIHKDAMAPAVFPGEPLPYITVTASAAMQIEAR